MCGRARLSSDVSEIKIAFGIPPERPAPNFAASWNVAPTDPLPIVRFGPTAQQRSLDIARWGLIPYWAKDIKIGYSTFKCPCRGYRHQARFSRGLPPAALPRAIGQFLRMGAIALKGGRLMAMAGLWESWRSP